MTIEGSVFKDANRNGRPDVRDVRERGLSGWTVQLLDADGLVVAETVTNASGRYAFSGLDLGSYTVQTVDQAGWVQTTAEPAAIAIAQGTTVSNIDFGYARSRRTA